MPILKDKVYVEIAGKEKAYECESIYYLDFQITSALFSLERLNDETHIGDWANKCQYYHYYSDHLLYSIGQIANRFATVSGDNKESRDRKKQNRLNFSFDDTEFVILSTKYARNAVEHIDSYNSKIIEKHNGVGGFNLIDKETDLDQINRYRKKRYLYPYTLDLINYEILLRNDSNFTVSLSDLRVELDKLQRNVSSFREKVYSIL